MTAQELQTIERLAYENLESALHKARTLYATKNAKFQLGVIMLMVT